MWNRASVCPVGMAELGPDVWNPEGVKVLGTPVGSRTFVAEVINKRLREDHKLWGAIPWVPDLQAAWQILIQCAGPRCHHILRTLLPSQAAEYAQRHDDGSKPWTICCDFQEKFTSKTWRATLLLCRCAWEVWAPEVHREWHPEHIGLHGQMLCT